MLTLAFIIQPVRAEPRTWIVDDYGAGDFNTIQQAIDAASSGDIIFVCNGTYYEHLTIGKSLSLIGENKLYTTIDGNSTGDVVSITSDDTRIVNFTIQYGYSGISLLHCRNNSISSNILLNNNRGVAVNCSDDNLFFHNDFVNNAQQVYDYSWEKIDYPPSINIWDDGYPSGGNYWSNYIGNDTYSGPFQDVVCSDGLGDMPFEIDQNNEDRYPLMLPWDDPYNHQAAYNYAFKYYNRVSSDGWFWLNTNPPPVLWPPSQPLPSQPAAPGFDCAHFLSCCIGKETHEIGGGLDVPPAFPGYNPYHYGKVNVADLYNWLINSGLGVKKDSVYELIKGDAIFYTYTPPLGGVGILNELSSHSTLYIGYLQISCHSYSRFGLAYDSSVLPPTRYYVHIKGPLPQVSTLPAPVVGTSATLNGNLDSNGGEDCEVWFVWDTASHTSYESYAYSTPHQTMYAWQTGSFQAILSSLAPGTYHFRAVAKNYEGTVQGADLIFIIIPPPKTLTIQTPSGSGSTNPGVGTYQYSQGTDVPVTAYPSSGWILDHWELDSNNVGNANPYHVIMNNDHTLKAVFIQPPPPTITFYTDPSDKGSITFSGTPYTNGQSGQYAAGPYALSANAPSGWTFSQWQTTGGVTISGSTATVTGAGTVKAVFTQIKYTLTVQVDGSGTTSPAPGSYQYDQGSVVPVTALPSSGYKLDRWQLDGSNVGNANPYSVTMNSNHTLKAFFVVTPLTVHISPLSASIHPGQSITFTSTVSGGQPPYGYQWYLDGAPVSGATTSTWVFTPTTSGIYYVYLKVTDDNNNVAQSETARITVSTVPVGGYSFPIQVQTKTEPIIPYIALVAALTAVFTKLRPKTKRKR
jgi:parallel beta-helix repeat protein